jgi:SPOR domain
MNKLILFLLTLISSALFSQTTTDSATSNELKSNIIDHSGVQKYIEKHQKIIKKKPFVEGYRIQIYNGNNKEDANKIKVEFYSNYPGMRCYLNYQQPYYKVRVGDYQDQGSAKADLKKMARTYPSSFLVPDQIRRMDKDEDKKD